MSGIEITNHGSIFSYAKEKVERRKQGYTEVKKSVVKISCHQMTIKVLWSKNEMDKTEYNALKLEVGPTVAEEFAKSAGVCKAQIELWNTHKKTVPNSHPKPRDYSYLMPQGV